MWDDLPQNSTNNAILIQKTCVKTGGRHFEHVFKETVFAEFWTVIKLYSPKCQISRFSFDFNTSTMMKIVIFIVILLLGSVLR